MKEGVTGAVTCKLYNSFNSNFLCIEYIKKNLNYISICIINYIFPKNIKELNKNYENKK